MTAYIRRSHPEKKRVNLVKREHSLQKALRSNCPPDKIDQLAEKVRDSYITYQKGLIYYANDVGRNEEIDTAQITKSEAKVKVWSDLPTVQIIEKYR